MNIFKKLIIASTMLFSTLSFADDYINAEKVKNEVDQTVEGKIVVQQFLWHKCIHCYKLEPLVDKWLETKPSFIEFERIPVAWTTKHKEEAKFYNYAKTLNKTGKLTSEELTTLNNDLFKITFEEEKELNAENVYPIFAKYGVDSPDTLTKLVNSFVASSENTKGTNLTNKYGISGVPVFVINGKYIVGFQTLKEGEVNPENLFKAIESIAKSEFEKNK